MFVILRAYFDDSGTHADSDVVVMGGLLGTVAQWEDFGRQWIQKLRCPLPNKPPLKRFHLSTCNARKGEFASYSDAEQNAVIHDFREIIINAKLTSTASVIDRKAWDKLVVGRYREVLHGLSRRVPAHVDAGECIGDNDLARLQRQKPAAGIQRGLP